MTFFQLFAITAGGPLPLPVAATAETLADLYDGMPLGVYSALRTFEHNKFLCLDEHIDRTCRSMALLGWEYDWDLARFRRALDAVCSAFPADNARVRFDILAAPIALAGGESRELIALTPLTAVPEQYYREGVGVDFAPALHRIRPLAKTADFADRRRSYVVGTREHFEVLMLDETDHILEGSGTNFWAVRNGVVWTAGTGVLEGVTRKIILQLLPELGIPLRMEAVRLQDVPLLDEAALSGSSRALLPVVNIAGTVVGDGRPGPICSRILAAYNAYLAREIRTAVESL